MGVGIGVALRAGPSWSDALRAGPSGPEAVLVGSGVGVGVCVTVGLSVAVGEGDGISKGVCVAAGDGWFPGVADDGATGIMDGDGPESTHAVRTPHTVRTIARATAIHPRSPEPVTGGTLARTPLGWPDWVVVLPPALPAG